MARTHIVSPLPADYLREVAAFFRSVADGYAAAADSLDASGMPTIHVQHFGQLMGGMDKLLSHYLQVVDSVRQLDAKNRFDVLQFEPIPHARYDLTKDEQLTDVEVAVRLQAEQNGWMRPGLADPDEVIIETLRKRVDRGEMIVIAPSGRPPRTKPSGAKEPAVSVVPPTTDPAKTAKPAFPPKTVAQLKREQKEREKQEREDLKKLREKGKA